MKIACYTDIHNQQCMLNIPTVLRSSAVKAAQLTAQEWGCADLAIVGGDNVSDYPYWNRSCALPYANWLDIKQKLVDNFARVAKNERVLYVNGNNDLMLGDLPTDANPPYNTCEFYESGPMKHALGILSEDDCIGMYAKAKGVQAGLYHLAFHYVVDGVDFFGINIDPDTAFNSHEGNYNLESLAWLKDKLNAVDPTGDKLIFVVGHLSATVRKFGAYREDLDPAHRAALYGAFAGHRNLFYLYGHIHGQGCVYQDSADGILHFDQSGDLMEVRADALTPEQKNNLGFRTVHMGGLRPFTTKTPFEYFEEDGMTGTVPGTDTPTFYEATGTPKLAQFLLIETGENAVTFRYRNTGSLEGYSVEDLPTACTAPLL